MAAAKQLDRKGFSEKGYSSTRLTAPRCINWASPAHQLMPPSVNWTKGGTERGESGVPAREQVDRGGSSKARGMTAPRRNTNRASSSQQQMPPSVNKKSWTKGRTIRVEQGASAPAQEQPDTKGPTSTEAKGLHWLAPVHIPSSLTKEAREAFRAEKEKRCALAVEKAKSVLFGESRVPGVSERNYREECGRTCPLCGFPCVWNHGDSCPPCVHEVPIARSLLGLCKDGPVQIAGAIIKGAIKNVDGEDNHMHTRYSFTLRGKPCSIIAIVYIGDEEFAPRGVCLAACELLVQQLEKLGFQDKAIVNVYDMLTYKTWALMESSVTLKLRHVWMTDGEYPSLTIEDISPSCNVICIVSWGGRVKVAGKWRKQEVAMVGDHQLGPENLYDLHCYGDSDTPVKVGQVSIREGGICSRDHLMLVPEGLEAEKLFGVAQELPQLETVAQKLLEYEDVAWVVNLC